MGGGFALTTESSTMPQEKIIFLYPSLIKCWNECLEMNIIAFFMGFQDFIEVFMDDFSVFGNSFDSCLNNLSMMLARCEETNLVLNWEKCHFMVREGIVLGHKISKAGIEVDKTKVEKFLADVKKYIWDNPYLFKSCPDGIVRRCIFGKESHEILKHCHAGPTGGHYGADITARIVFESGFYWPTIFKDSATYVRECDACQKARNISSISQMSMTNILLSEVFDICSSQNNKYILVAVDYVSN
ncbi:reverse transcriptase domain-containing protein [Tanacetum coccineum]